MVYLAGSTPRCSGVTAHPLVEWASSRILPKVWDVRRAAPSAAGVGPDRLAHLSQRGLSFLASRHAFSPGQEEG
jgi:hypothetical protein